MDRAHHLRALADPAASQAVAPVLSCKWPSIWVTFQRTPTCRYVPTAAITWIRAGAGYHSSACIANTRDLTWRVPSVANVGGFLRIEDVPGRSGLFFYFPKRSKPSNATGNLSKTAKCTGRSPIALYLVELEDHSDCTRLTAFELGYFSYEPSPTASFKTAIMVFRQSEGLLVLANRLSDRSCRRSIPHISTA